LEDFSYLLTIDGLVFHLREVRPKDFYFAQILRQRERSMFELVERLIQNSEVLELATVPQTRSMIDWVATNILEKNILTVENWLEIGFHLCKQRWNDSLDWLELQPMSKIQTMIEVVKNHVEDVESAQKKAARG
jgi:hypothetical protein